MNRNVSNYSIDPIAIITLARVGVSLVQETDAGLIHTGSVTRDVRLISEGKDSHQCHTGAWHAASDSHPTQAWFTL